MVTLVLEDDGGVASDGFNGVPKGIQGSVDYVDVTIAEYIASAAGDAQTPFWARLHIITDYPR